ncbi:MAG: acetyltransferase [Nostoc sp.]|uniref:acetyltransferase n=1 Tax=Nostoc sp. TaxID=1180 RepID=UPI002FF76D65
MKRLLIVGAGGFGREVLLWASDVSKHQSEWSVAGFLCDDLNALDNYDYDIPIVGGIQDYIPSNEDLLVMAIADTRNKLDLAKKLEERGAKFITLIHPTVIVAKNANIGRGCVFCPFSSVSCDTSVGNFVTVNTRSGIGHDSKIDDGCTLSSHVDLGGYVELGRGVFIGSSANLLPKTKIGDFATIGAGSVVLRSVKSGVTVFGVPAKTILQKNE